MGWQAYITRLALGRSAYEPLVPETVTVTPHESSGSNLGEETEQKPTQEAAWLHNRVSDPGVYVQQYDSHGYPDNPASRTRGRRSRRAQNEVLAVAGVLAGPDQDSQTIGQRWVNRAGRKAEDEIEEDTIELLKDESVNGVFISLFGKAAFYSACLCMVGVRNRFQTFRFYAGVPLGDIMKTEWTTLKPSHFILGGQPSRLLFTLLHANGIGVVYWLYNHTMMHIIWRVKSRRRRRLLKMSAALARKILSCLIFILIAPMELHSTAQRLALIPFWPFLPSLKAMAPFSSESLVQPVFLTSNLDPKSLWQLLSLLASSPLVLAYVLVSTRRVVRRKLCQYLPIFFIKPDNPDADSINAAVEDELDSQKVSGLGFYLSGRSRTAVKESTTVTEQARRDWRLLKSAMNHILSDWSSTIAILRTGNIPGHRLRTPLVESYAQISVQKFELLLPDVEVEPVDVVPPEGVAVDDPESHRLDSNLSSEAIPADQSLGLNDPRIESGNNDPGDHSSNLSQVVTGTQDALPMDSLWTDPSRPRHRVTFLTAMAADKLATQLSTQLADWILLPLEALFVRSVALSFARSRAAPSSAPWLQSEIYPLGSWWGMGIRGGRAGDYMMKTVLCCGVEMALGLGVWQMTTGLAWWFGTRAHGWGKL